jgi:TRAP-type C4-dicarboxylate transport system permease small subunit
VTVWRSAVERRLDTVLGALDRVFCWVLTAAMATMLVASVVQVAARYAFHATVIGPDEIARYMMVGGTFLAIPVLAKRRNHIAVDAVVHFLPIGVARVWLHRLLTLVETVFLLGFAVFSWEVLRGVHESGQFSAGLQIPASWPFSTVFVGSLLGALVTAILFLQSWLSPDPSGGVDSYLDVEELHATEAGQ